MFRPAQNYCYHINKPLLGMAFVVHKNIIKTVKEVTPINNRLMTMRMKHKNKYYTIVNALKPTNVDNKKDSEGVEKYWDTIKKKQSAKSTKTTPFY